MKTVVTFGEIMIRFDMPDHRRVAQGMPGPVNTLRHTYFNAGMQARCEGLVTKFRVDPVQIAAEYFEAGRRLELGPKQRLSAPPDARVH